MNALVNITQETLAVLISIRFRPCALNIYGFTLEVMVAGREATKRREYCVCVCVR